MNNRVTLPIKAVYEGLYDGPHATPATSEVGPVFLGIKNVSESGQLDLSDVRHISMEEYPRWIKRVKPMEGDIVFSYEATLNRYALIPKYFHGCLGRRMALIRPNESKISCKFLFYYFFCDEWRKVISMNTLYGSTVDRIPIAKFPDFPITIPPLLVQQKIAAVLSTYDDLIENNLRRIKILEEMAQNLYREWFVKFRFPGHEHARFTDSPLGKIPEGWECGIINDLTSLKSGFAFKSSIFTEDGIYGLVTIRNVHDGLFITDCTSQITVLPENMPKYCNLLSGDILISLTGNIGRVCLVYGNDYVLNQRVAKLVPNDAKNRAYVYFTFRQDEVQTKLSMIANGVAQQNLSPIETGQMQIVIPSQKYLIGFHEFCEPIIEQLIAIYQKNSILRRTRDLLLPKLISGDIDVSELDITVPEEVHT